jgi:hypothetical protein
LILITIRKYPDIDSFSPIIDFLAKKKIKIIIISLNLADDFRKDFRISYLLKKYSNLEFIHISECFLLNLLQYFFLNSEMFLINKSLFYRFIHILINKLKINNFLKNILFNDNNIKFKDLKVNKIVIDHLTPKKIFYFNFYFNFLKKNKVKILSIPAGLPLYVKHPKAWDKAKKEISDLSYLVDTLVLQHKYWAGEIKRYRKTDSRKIKILGTPRYLSSWRKILSKIVPLQKIDCKLNKLNIVYMDSNNPDHIDFPEQKEKTIIYLSKMNNINLKFKPHPRSNKIYIDIPDNVEVVRNIESINLIKWADIIIGDISAIMIEAILSNKIFISLRYLRKQQNQMIYEKFKVCEIADNLNDLIKIIQKSHDKKNKYNNKKNIKKFMYVVLGERSDNLLRKYYSLLNK